MNATAGLAALPDTFDYTDARRAGLSSRRLGRLRERGEIEQISRGLYRRADAEAPVDLDLTEIAHRVPDGTLCLTTALAKHGLTDQIPPSNDVAIPRGRRPRRLAAPVTWHHFVPETFRIGRETLDVGGGETIGIYGPERCIIDVFRLRHHEGTDLAIEALRSWLRRPDSKPSSLLATARAFPAALPSLRTTMEVLL